MVALSREALAGASVLVIGDVMLDRYWFGNVERISPEAPVPIVHVQREEFRLGGAANVARNIAALGGSATLLSVVGADEAAGRLARLLGEAGIGSMLQNDPELSTTVKLRVSGRAQQLLRIDFESRPARDLLDRLIEDYCSVASNYDAIILSDYGKGVLAEVQKMIEYARKVGKPILVDPKGDNYARYAGATVVTPNRGELSQVVGRWESEEELEAKGTDLRHSLDLAGLLVTRSEEGMSLFDEDGALHVPAQTREVFDVTGAGDTVIATLGLLVAIGMPLRDAVLVANRAGGIVVGKFGTATVDYEELVAEG